jgi:phosphoribosylanthranilate isomerase
MPKVKICGITNLRDALASEKAGADIIGFIFAKSPRRIKPVNAKRIIRALKLSTMKAGVFVDEAPEAINALVKSLKLNIVQLHGNESPAYARKIKGAKVIKAIRAKDRKTVLRESKRFDGIAYALLFDAFDMKTRGGTGKAFNVSMVDKIKKPFFIAGGLGPKNIREVIRKAKPYGVDVNSGVESRPGKKDHKKIKAFFKAISY